MPWTIQVFNLKAIPIILHGVAIRIKVVMKSIYFLLLYFLRKLLNVPHWCGFAYRKWSAIVGG